VLYLSAFRKTLRVNDKYGGIVVIIMSGMEKSMRDPLPDKINVLWPQHFKVVDTKISGIEHHFQCTHFSIYTRYAPQVWRALSTGSLRCFLKFLIGT